MDRHRLPAVDIVHELEAIPWPIPASSVSEVKAHHVLEHLHNLIGVMEEVHRVLEADGTFRITVPYYRHEGAFADPTHVRFFTEHTFDYFSPVNPLNYYSVARFKVVEMKFGWMGILAWHIDRHAPRALQGLLHRVLLNRKYTLNFVLGKM
ncbi:MAG TPA: methyltransferase domain-containing protein [Thermoplasmata archaeon]|nr:methyltransferase domain-containing protein [Thermoplasmata archaeon]